MTFLNPIWLLALPLIALPILIHLWNQRRHRTINWGAMQFLLSARRMSRGMARLRHWLIMASRMLVIAALIFVISRPLSSGWLGTLSGGAPETVLILLDRSASMQQQLVATGETKLSAGMSKLVEALETMGGNSQVYLVDPFQKATGDLEPSSTDSISGLKQPINFGKVIPIERPRDLLDLPEVSPTEAQTDVVGMLQAALDFVTNNQSGRTDIWICSDNAENDWNADSSRWNALNGGFAELEGVRFHLLSFTDQPNENFSVDVERWERTSNKEQAELVIDLNIRRTTSATSTTTELPVTFNINGVRSVTNVTIDNDTATLIGHRIPIDRESPSGWGSVEIPTDGNPSDNAFYFAYAEPPPRQTVVVTTNPAMTKSLELAASVPSQNGIQYDVKQLTPDRVAEIDWQLTSLVIWAAPLPAETTALQLTRFVESGRVVVFLPPSEPDSTSFAGASWEAWQRNDSGGEKIGYWNNDSDLLARTRDGQPLPIDDLLVYRYCKLTSGGSPLASLDNGDPLLTRIVGNGGLIYFLTTWPLGTHSSLDREGISLYVMVQRALAAGSETLGAAKQLDAGTLAAQGAAELPILAGTFANTNSGNENNAALRAISRLRPFRAGVFGTPDQLMALNRPPAEDQSPALTPERIEDLFTGLDYRIINAQLGGERSLASEIWRFFVVAMVIALLAEAALCMPERLRKTQTDTTVQPTRAAA